MLGYTTGLRALLAAQYGLDVVGNNIANASTDGYSRQLAVFRASRPFDLAGVGQIGTGVGVSEVRRVANPVLEGRIRTQIGLFGQADSSSVRMTEIESFFGEPADSALSGLFSSFFDGISKLTSSPDDAVLQQAVIDDGGALASGVRQLTHSFAGLRTDIEADVRAKIEEANSLLESIAKLNVQIAAAETGGGDGGGSALKDVRERTLRDLSKLVGVSVLEDGSQVRVLLEGRVLVSGNRASTIEVTRTRAGALELSVAGSNAVTTPKSGEVAGLLEIFGASAPELEQRIDAIARSLILEFNRRHSTGMPASGPLKTLTSASLVRDVDGDQNFLEERLANAGFPFPVKNGSLNVAVTDGASGKVTTHRIAIDPSMTVGDLVQALNDLPHLSASVDGSGRMHLGADTGFGFDFTGRVDPNPDDAGTFGSAQATISSLGAQPYALNDGDQISIAVDAGAPQVVTFAAADFADVAQATAAEVAQVINDQTTGVEALVVDGRVVVRSETEGTQSSLLISDVTGTPAEGLELSQSLETGATATSAVSISGHYQGARSGSLTFRARGDGEIGITPGLMVEVRDETGRKLADLDVGEGYEPGSALSLGNGLSVTFGPGAIAEQSGDFFSTMVNDSGDSADVLVAFGLNTFFTGSSASDIDVRSDLVEDPRLLAISLGGEAGTGDNLPRLLELRDRATQDLGMTVTDAYRAAVSSLGQDVHRAQFDRDTQEKVLATLDAQREQVSGVSVDEELLQMQQYQQMYQAAARYLQTLNDVTDTLMNL
ncbi:MAG: flagellar hook-associated protein FlgK [Planctomycetota bacterium]